jgi:hypothetical protein
MATISSFRNEIRQDVPDAPLPTLDRANLWAIRDFCTETLIDKEWLTTISSVDGQAEYTLTPTSGYEVVNLVRVLYEDDPIKIVTENWLNHKFRGSIWRETESSGPTWCYLSTDRGSIRLVYIPESDGDDLDVYVAIRPTRTATAAADLIYKDWYEVIADGARGYLYGMMAMPWGNPQLSEYYNRKYRDGKGKAKAYVCTYGITTPSNA